MKSLSIWNVLSILVIFGICLTAGVVGLIFANPYVPINPFPPATPVPVLVFPTDVPATPTPPSMPPTWTPTAGIKVNLAPTSTARPTNTPVPSRTPFILPSPTTAPTSLYATKTRMPMSGECKVVSQTPTDGQSYAKGTVFTTKWTLQNTSDTAWDKSSADVRYLSGEQMQTGATGVDLPKTVDVGSTIDVTITMKAPDAAGYHITYWTVSVGSAKTLCTFYVEIFTEK